MAAAVPEVPYVRPTLAATRGYCIPPGISGRVWVLQRARARRMHRLGCDWGALPRVGALDRTDIAGDADTQAGKRWTREALVWAGAGFHDDYRTGKTGATG